MNIFAPIVASVVLACVATQGDLIAQNRDSDLRQQIRRIVREEMKRALAEIHESRGRAVGQKQATARAERTARSRKSRRVAETRRAQPRKTAPQRRSSPSDALNRAHKALENARRALAEAERALNRARRAGPRPTTARTVRRGEDGIYIVETKTAPRIYRTNVKIKGRPLRVVTPKIERLQIQIPRIEVPHFEVRMVRPVFEFGEAKPHQVELAPITEVKRAKKKSQKKKKKKKKSQKKQPKARKAKKRTGRIV